MKGSPNENQHQKAQNLQSYKRLVRNLRRKTFEKINNKQVDYNIATRTGGKKN